MSHLRGGHARLDISAWIGIDACRAHRLTYRPVGTIKVPIVFNNMTCQGNISISQM